MSWIVLLGIGCGHDAVPSADHVTPPPPTAATAGSATSDPDLLVETVTFVDLDTKLARLCQIPDSRIYFKFDSTKLRAESKALLDQIATCSLSGPAKGLQLRVIGRTDPRGTDSYNQTLGMSRADAVAGYLKNAGVVNARMATLSKGEADANSSSSGWPFDRRVTVRLDLSTNPAQRSPRCLPRTLSCTRLRAMTCSADRDDAHQNGRS